MTQEMTVREAAEYSRIVAAEWGSDFADLLTAFNANQVNKSLFGLFASTHRENQPVRYDELSRGFLRLYDSKVLVPEFSLAGIPEEQLQTMREKAAYVPPAPPVNPAIAVQSAHDAAVAECASDFRSVSGAAFKNKWLGVRRDVYEAACQAGRI